MRNGTKRVRERAGAMGMALAMELEKLETRVLYATTPLPVVSLTTVTGEAWEAQPGTHPGALLLTRTGSTATALTVTLGIFGTAVPGTHYFLQGPQGAVGVVNNMTQVTI